MNALDAIDQRIAELEMVIQELQHVRNLLVRVLSSPARGAARRRGQNPTNIEPGNAEDQNPEVEDDPEREGKPDKRARPTPRKNSPCVRLRNALLKESPLSQKILIARTGVVQGNIGKTLHRHLWFEKVETDQGPAYRLTEAGRAGTVT